MNELDLNFILQKRKIENNISYIKDNLHFFFHFTTCKKSLHNSLFL